MGMDFPNGGSASYPRFDSMLRRIATVFGAVESTRSKEYAESVEGKLEWWFGTFPRDAEPKFSWPEDVPACVREFVENPYDERWDAEDLLKHLQQKFPDESDYEGEDNIYQILSELEFCAECNDGYFHLIQ